MKRYFSKLILLLLIILFMSILKFSIFAFGESNNLAWIIEPELEYDNIYYCSVCRYNLFGIEPELFTDFNISFFESDENILNFKNNISKFKVDNSAYISVGHGFSTDLYFYDEEKEIFAVYSSSESGAGLEYYTPDDFTSAYDRLIAVRTANSEKLAIDDEKRRLDEAYIGGKYALMYGKSFVTGFIYDDYKSRGSRHTVSDLIDMKFGGKWGVIDKNGNTAISFLFDDIEFLDDNAAFVKYENKYGVINLRQTIAVSPETPVRPPATGRGVSIHFFILLLVSAVILKTKTKKYKFINRGEKL